MTSADEMLRAYTCYALASALHIDTRAQGPWPAKGWWSASIRRPLLGGVSGPMAGQRVRGDASTAGGITLQHMDMTKLMMNDGMWSVIKWAIIWPE